MIHRALPLPLLLLATPALAQDADPSNQLIEGYVACLMARGDAEVIAQNLALYGWTFDPPSEGIVSAFPGVGGDTFMLLAQDARFCQVSSLSVGTRRAAEMLGYSMQPTGLSIPEPQQDDLHCPTYDFGQGITATLSAGGDDPACSADTTSTLMINFVPQD